MECPKCKSDIAIFETFDDLGNIKICPHCNTEIKICYDEQCNDDCTYCYDIWWAEIVK